MSAFRRLSDTMFASPQITPDDVATAKAEGITMIINNRPDGESDDQTPGADIEAAAIAAGLKYVAIPIGQAGFSEPQVKAMNEALAASDGPVLGYCRSGTRSTFLWSLAQSAKGADPEDTARAAAGAGYDVSPIRSAMDIFVAQANSEPDV